MEDFSKTEILVLLHAVDDVLKTNMEIVIGGSAAGILLFGISRRTQDIDILSSVPALGILSPNIEKIGAAYQLTPKWLNDAA